MFFNKNINDCKLLVFDLDGTILDKNQISLIKWSNCAPN